MRVEQDFDINLLTPSLQGEAGRSISLSRTLYLLVVCLMVLGWAGTWGWHAFKERSQRMEITRLQDQLSGLMETGIIDQAEILRNAVTEKENNIRGIRNDLMLYSEILTRLETAIPVDTNLSEISVTGDRLVCKGVITDYPTLARFISSVNRQKYMTGARCIMAEPVDSAVKFELQLQIIPE